MGEVECNLLERKTKKMNIPVTKAISELSYIEIKEGE